MQPIMVMSLRDRFRLMSNDHKAVAPGSKFGYLTTLGVAIKGFDGYYFPCMCDCGKPTFAKWTRMSAGSTTSCGCHKGNRTHGFRRTRLYSIWSNMKQRCGNRNVASFPNYGGRGISVCDEWMKFGAFKDWALNTGYDDAMTLERVDVNGNYDPDNCTWIPMSAQATNRRSSIITDYQGERKSLKEWSRDARCVVKYPTLYHRVKSGWTMDDAMNTPTREGR